MAKKDTKYRSKIGSLLRKILKNVKTTPFLIAVAICTIIAAFFVGFAIPKNSPIEISAGTQTANTDGGEQSLTTDTLNQENTEDEADSEQEIHTNQSNSSNVTTTRPSGNGTNNSPAQNNEQTTQNNNDQDDAGANPDNPDTVTTPPVDAWANAQSCGTNCKYIIYDSGKIAMIGKYKGEVPLSIYTSTIHAMTYRDANPDKTTIKLVCGDNFILSIIYSEFKATTTYPREGYWCNKGVGHNGFIGIDGLYDINGTPLAGLKS